MLIDFHTHCFSPELIQNKKDYVKDPHFALLNEDESSRLADHTGLMRMCTEYGLDHAVAMGFPWFDAQICKEHNEYFSRLKGLTDGVVTCFGSVPLNETSSVSDWISEIAGLGLAGIGEVAFYRDGLTNNNIPFLNNIFKGARKYNLPVCIHVNEPVGHSYRGKYAPSFSELYQLLEEYNDVVTILSHWGGGLFVYELMPEVKQNLRNVYYDTAASPFIYSDDIYSIACSIAGDDRILFGSDYPLLTPKKYINAVRGRLADKKAHKKILGENAARILKL